MKRSTTLINHQAKPLIMSRGYFNSYWVTQYKPDNTPIKPTRDLDNIATIDDFYKNVRDTRDAMEFLKESNEAKYVINPFCEDKFTNIVKLLDNLYTSIYNMDSYDKSRQIIANIIYRLSEMGNDTLSYDFIKNKPILITHIAEKIAEDGYPFENHLPKHYPAIKIEAKAPDQQLLPDPFALKEAA